MQNNSKGGAASPRKIRVIRKNPVQGRGGAFASNQMENSQLVSAPAAIGRVSKGGRAQISAVAGGDLRVRVKYREYVQDITGSVAFALQQFNINPGLSTLFPWLSTLASMFESYKFNRLNLLFRSSSPSAQAGKTFLAVDWDVLDSAPASKQAMMQERTKADANVWLDLNLGSDSADLLKFGVQRYVRTGSAPVGSDLKTYDVGMLNVASQGVTNAPVIGELWVEYDVDLITPNTAPAPISEKITAGGASIAAASPFGATPVLAGNVPVVVAADGKTLTFQQGGNYFMELNGTGTATSFTPGGTATVTALTLVTSGAALIEGWSISTTPGQTVTVVGTGGTITALVARLAPYNVNLQ